MYRVLVIGAVNTTRHTLVQLIDHEFDIVGVLGHEPKYPSKISGWADLKEVSKGNDLNYKGFKKINDADNIEWAKKKKPDIIFAVGFSQLMKDDWLNMPTLGCIGFHPTNLPKGRGRAPIAWTVLEENKGSATFFLMGKGADDGPIFVQELFDVDKDDDAAIIESKIESAIKKSLKRWLPDLKKGIWDPTPQDDDKASWYGKRTQEDGVINWNDSAQYIDKLIKASTHPHPGAYTFLKDSKLIVWQCQLEDKIPI